MRYGNDPTRQEIKRRACHSTASRFDGGKATTTAPEGLTDAEKAVWQRIASAMPAGWFKREHLDMLAAFCQHAARSDEYNRMASKFEAGDVGDKIELVDLDRVTKMA